ncbi:MAG: hypothetical protein AB7K68_16255 [Bacteriovoracia bacterium]
MNKSMLFIMVSLLCGTVAKADLFTNREDAARAQSDRQAQVYWANMKPQIKARVNVLVSRMARPHGGVAHISYVSNLTFSASMLNANLVHFSTNNGLACEALIPNVDCDGGGCSRFEFWGVNCYDSQNQMWHMSSKGKLSR